MCFARYALFDALLSSFLPLWDLGLFLETGPFDVFFCSFFRSWVFNLFRATRTFVMFDFCDVLFPHRSSSQCRSDGTLICFAAPVREVASTREA